MKIRFLQQQQEQPVPLAPPPPRQGPPGMQNLRQQLGATVHPLAYSRELHMVRNAGLGPSALDKAIKAAEVCLCYWRVVVPVVQS